MHARTLLAVGAMCVAMVPSQDADAGWYLGAGAGQSRIDATTEEIEQAFRIDDAFTATGTTLDKTDTGRKAYLGYRFAGLFAIEGSYADLGNATFHTTIVGAPAPLDALTPFPIQGTATADGIELAALLNIPLPGRFSLLAKAGAFRWQAEFSEVIPATGVMRVDRTEEETDSMQGIGLQMRVAPLLAARIEWERLNDVGRGIGGRDGRDIDFLSASVVFNF
jgi:hypothetical protein